MSAKPQISSAEIQKRISAKVAEVVKEIEATHDLPKGQTIKINPSSEAWEVSYKT